MTEARASAFCGSALYNKEKNMSVPRYTMGLGTKLAMVVCAIMAIYVLAKILLH